MVRNRGCLRAIFVMIIMLVSIIPGITPGEMRGGGKVDLMISEQNVTITPPAGEAYVGDNLTINVSVVNLGDENATNVSVSFYEDSDLIGIFYFNQSPGHEIIEKNGGVENATMYWNTSEWNVTPNKNYTISIMVQNSTEQEDSNLTNNIVWINISLLPDVVPYVDNITADKYVAVWSEVINITAVIKNDGIRDAIQEPVSFYIDNETSPIDVIYVDIPAGGNATAVFEWNTHNWQPGNHTVTAKVRDTSKTTKNITLLWKVHPYIESVVVSPVEVHRGEEITINATVKNDGVYDAHNVTVRFFFDYTGTPFTNKTINVTSGGTEYIEFKWSTEEILPGNHTVKALIEGETRKVSSEEFTVLPKVYPDLTIQNLSSDKDVAYIGETVRIKFRVANIGESDIKTNFSVRVDVDYEKVIFHENITHLNASEYNEFEVLWNTTGMEPMVHKIMVTVDDLDNIVEKCETNNDDKIAVSLEGISDLIVEKVWITKYGNITDNITIGDEGIKVLAKISNIGTARADEGINITYYLDDNTLIGSKVTMQPIGPGNHWNATLKWDISLFLNDTEVTNHTIKVVVDEDNILKELNENNNVYITNITVHPKPPVVDLVAVNITFSRDIIHVGDMVMINCTIANEGKKDAENFSVEISDKTGNATQLIQRHKVETLKAGETMTFSDQWTFMREGVHQIVLTVNRDMNIYEEDTTNNEITKSVIIEKKIVRKPQINVYMAITPKTPKVNEEVTVIVYISNNGTADADEVSISFFVNELKIDEKKVYVPLGKTINVTFYWKAVKGTANMKVYVSYDSESVQKTEAIEVKVEEKEGISIDPTIIFFLILILLIGAAILFSVAFRKEYPKEEE